ncbi:alpha/beta fold hydrolase [Mycolicibacterium aromaticivorans]|uniref:alpha/beta fold hydrolase n=1 Tax=Mycolicibacterium aromaticivorans TaxID=318425 RepID=UPI0004B39ADB|nr:alpha/beta hydrolase [Mycolicibacterium aromaticivorans]
MTSRYLEAQDHPEIFVPHHYPEQIADLGEVKMNYATAGDAHNPAILLIPGQTESWWGYEQAMKLLSPRFQVYAVDLRGQGRSTWTPGRYSLDLFGSDLVRFIDRVIGRPVVVSGLSSGGVIAAWLSAYAAPGQIRAAVYEDAPLFSSEVNPAVGQSIRQAVGPLFDLLYKWLGAQWSIADVDGMRKAQKAELPAWMPAHDGVPQNLREYDPEWGHAFSTGTVARNCDHETMLARVKVPVLFTHHFRVQDPATGHLIGAISDQQVQHVQRLVEQAGNSFTYQSFPQMPHSMHGHDPQIYVDTVTTWLETLPS